MGREEESGSSIKTSHNGHLESSRIQDRDKENIPETPEVKLTPYERLSHDLGNDQKYLKEITLGKRIGFYRIRGELGTGNFSQVKMGIHSLTKGKPFPPFIDIYIILISKPQCCHIVLLAYISRIWESSINAAFPLNCRQFRQNLCWK